MFLFRLIPARPKNGCRNYTKEAMSLIEKGLSVYKASKLTGVTQTTFQRQKETVETYFQNLSEILEKYDIFSAPGLIYNIDESGFSPEHTPPKLAIGSPFLPFFILKGQRMLDELTEGTTQGAVFTNMNQAE